MAFVSVTVVLVACCLICWRTAGMHFFFRAAGGGREVLRIVDRLSGVDGLWTRGDGP